MQPAPAGKDPKPYNTFYITATLVRPSQTMISRRPTIQPVGGFTVGATRYNDCKALLLERLNSKWFLLQHTFVVYYKMPFLYVCLIDLRNHSLNKTKVSRPMQVDATSHYIVACCWGVLANNVASVCLGQKL